MAKKPTKVEWTGDILDVLGHEIQQQRMVEEPAGDEDRELSDDEVAKATARFVARLRHERGPVTT